MLDDDFFVMAYILDKFSAQSLLIFSVLEKRLAVYVLPVE
jgi:hypothetical protein